MIRSYFTVAETIENTNVIERSKFICSIKGVKDEADARSFIEEIRKKHSLANHNCYAYIADDKGLIQKFSDDGEPQGTAGLPMLEVLKNKKMYKTVAVVTRYFGGIKLGTGGLTRAYGGAVSECLSIAKINDMQPSVILKLEPDYEIYSKLIKLLCDENVKVLSTDFADNVEVKIAVKSDYSSTFITKITDYFNGKLIAEKIDEGHYAF
jgi:uncharacterized YigZ family protein